MTTHEAIMERCERLYEDLSLQYVAEWKQQRQNGKAIGFLPVYFPRELVYAAGILPVGIMGGGDQIEIIKGDAYYQSYICHLPRSVVEMGVSGKLNALDGMIFPSICDVIRNLSGMWRVMFPDKESIYFDAPQNLNKELGGEFYYEELKRIVTILEKMSGIAVTQERLAEAIDLYNINRQLVEKLYQRRSAKPWDIPTAELYLLLRAGNILDVKEHNVMMQEYLDQVGNLGRKPQDNSRVVLKGAFCEQPPIGLIRALERSGGYIVDDDFVFVMRWLVSPIPKEGDILKHIAHAFVNDSREGAFKYKPENRGDELLQSYHDNKADGVIFCAASFCDPGLLEQPLLHKVLEENHVSYTTFQYAENTGQYGSIREQVGTFSDSIKLWGEA